MIKTIDGAAFSRMMLSAAAEIDLNKQKVNELNVFPVPDGDTGTNMSMTLSAASTELRKADGITLTKAADKTASALLRGARGNSGVILSLLFRGFSKSLKGKLEADGKDFAAALTAGVEAAYKAVMKPAEGTILTVSRLTADAARDLAVENNEIEYVLQHCLDTAHAALDNTVNQNPVLKKAGVVDAGGMGFCLILRGMLESLRGNDIVCEDAGAVNEEADFGIFDSEDITFAFDTVFIVRKREDITSLDPLREYLGSIGDSLVIGEDDEAFKVHVHTNIPGDALSEAQKYGTLELAKIENMRLQHDDLTAGRKARSTDDLEAVEKELENQPAKQEAPAEPEKRYGSVAVCAGAGLAGVFRDLGVDEIIEGGQTMNPSTEDILHAIEKTPAEIVFVLPNNKNIIMAAQAAAELASREVVVIPTKTVPQGISAMLAFDASMEPEENEAAMTDCLSGVMTMQITYAARDSDFDGFDIHAGDYLGLCDGALAGTTREITTLLASLADKAAEAGKEFINIFYGADIQEPDAEAALELFRQHAPDAEVNLVSGGQPIYYYLISAE
ncbi:MAG: DAK2 domain-containing protein [Oscillospiraceae bacterium]